MVVGTLATRTWSLVWLCLQSVTTCGSWRMVTQEQQLLVIVVICVFVSLCEIGHFVRLISGYILYLYYFPRKLANTTTDHVLRQMEVI
jgi:hypothetical protein